MYTKGWHSQVYFSISLILKPIPVKNLFYLSTGITKASGIFNCVHDHGKRQRETVRKRERERNRQTGSIINITVRYSIWH